MSDFRKTHQVKLPVDAPPRSLRQVIKKVILAGAPWGDWIEVKRGDKIVCFGVMTELVATRAGEKV